uniref:Integrase catalytic domain-containing protein n=1 Tax=Meloidogyne hapla TaxID=6305 RepID=A0A1I8B094_MELHA
MIVDIKQYIKTCESCQKIKENYHPNHEELYPIKKPNIPFEHLHMDIIGPVITSNKGSKYILSIIDSFSKYLICYPLKDQTAPSIMRIIIDQIITKYGVPRYITSDQGRNFTSQIMKDISKIFGFEQLFTVSYHQSANGQIERANRIIKSILSHYVDKEGSTQYSPFYILYGRKMKLPIDRLLESNNNEQNNTDITLFQENLENKLINIWKQTKINIEKAQDKQKKNFDIKANPSNYKIGDYVLKKVEVPTNKFSKKYDGPFQIISINKPNITLKENESKIIETHLYKVKYFNIKSPLELRERPYEKIKYKDKNLEEEESE